ncbi:D-sedoheptulose 7-phosphate isomerase [Rhodoflexus caldus]|uniref:D-sedoheptulose 7-phosphate isomerase n=1 Tax=Rhodoflexus caldus TaxID=2891236 RepID=UPI00202A4B3F|nr:D-sedoheptulose 7-phosphate isomerase [Rhodoflexus caldus]
MDFQQLVARELQSHVETIAQVQATLSADIQKAAEMVTQTIIGGCKILLFGNGGSAADAQHIAAEFTGRFVKERRGLPAIALTTDTSALTAIGNDYGYDRVFERQVEALARPGDLLIGITTSGNSPNVLLALAKGRAMGCQTLALTGKDGGKASQTADLNIVVPSQVTARIQEMHILIGHILCAAVDEIA